MSEKAKVVERHGFLYSREPFDGYKIRAQIQVRFRNMDFVDYRNSITMDIYTNNTNRESVGLALDSNEEIVLLGILVWNTKEQDDMMSEFIDKVLNYKE